MFSFFKSEKMRKKYLFLFGLVFILLLTTFVSATDSCSIVAKAQCQSNNNKVLTFSTPICCLLTASLTFSLK